MDKSCNALHLPQRPSVPCSFGQWTKFAASHIPDTGDFHPLHASAGMVPPAQRKGTNDEPIAGLVFEVDNVLCDGTIWRRWLLRALSQLGLYTHYGPFFRIWDRDFLPDAQRGEQPFVEVFRRFLLSAGLSRGEVDELVAAGMSQWHKLEQEARPFPCVRSTLTALRQAGFQLGVLTDSIESKDEVRRKLDRLGLSPLFQETAASRDLKTVKPDRVCYQASARGLGLPESRVAFVGARTRDLVGAASTGMRTIAFDYEANASADAYVNRFVDLQQLIPDITGARQAA